MEWNNGEFALSDELARVDLDALCELLHSTHWAVKRPREIIAKSLCHSINFSLRHRGRQIGFARVVTDHATYSYLCDVVIAAEFRAQGLGKWMLGCVLDHPALTGTRMDLLTKDAQEFYRAFGFTPHPFTCMARPLKGHPDFKASPIAS